MKTEDSTWKDHPMEPDATNSGNGAQTGASRSVPPAGDATEVARFTLGLWAFYFIVKLVMYWDGLIGFHPWINLAFAAFILVPVSHRAARWIKLLVTIALAIALLYYDSWLPSFGRVMSQASLVATFSTTYLIELLGRFFDPKVVALLATSCACAWLISRWLRLDALVIIAMMAVPVTVYFQHPVDQPDYEHYTDSRIESTVTTPTTSAPEVQPAETAGKTSPETIPVTVTTTKAAPPPVLPAVLQQPPEEYTGSGENMDAVLQKFFAREAKRSVTFPAPRTGDAPFDIVFIHICSLSWDDLRATGLDSHPLWKHFDFLMTHFNSASTYSGPAAIRVQRATCGQQAHAKLYDPAPGNCYLMSSLKNIGYEPALALNHDGHFDNFLKTVQAQAGMNITPFPLTGSDITQHAFDDTPIYDDLSVLDRWLGTRQKSFSPRVALFYNTISLHDGNHLSGSGAKLNSIENYRMRLNTLLDELDRFMQDIEQSGRRAVVAIVPEHGAAVRGDKMQIAGLREIPSPSITLVPVGIKVIGPGAKRRGDTLTIDQPTSYLAMSYLIARLLQTPPYNRGTFAPQDYATGVPLTPFVSQNEDIVMMGLRGRYYYRPDRTSGWIDYTNF